MRTDQADLFGCRWCPGSSCMAHPESFDMDVIDKRFFRIEYTLTDVNLNLLHVRIVPDEVRPDRC